MGELNSMFIEAFEAVMGPFREQSKEFMELHDVKKGHIFNNNQAGNLKE